MGIIILSNIFDMPTNNITTINLTFDLDGYGEHHFAIIFYYISPETNIPIQIDIIRFSLYWHEPDQDSIFYETPERPVEFTDDWLSKSENNEISRSILIIGTFFIIITTFLNAYKERTTKEEDPLGKFHIIGDPHTRHKDKSILDKIDTHTDVFGCFSSTLEMHETTSDKLFMSTKEEVDEITKDLMTQVETTPKQHYRLEGYPITPRIKAPSEQRHGHNDPEIRSLISLESLDHYKGHTSSQMTLLCEMTFREIKEKSIYINMSKQQLLDSIKMFIIELKHKHFSKRKDKIIVGIGEDTLKHFTEETQSQHSNQDSDWKQCPYCGEWNTIDRIRCTECDARLGQPQRRTN